MEQETLFNILTGQYGEVLETHAMWECISALGIKPFKDGNQWCFLYGENIQEGVCGFGETIYKAAWDFYTNVKIEEARKEDNMKTLKAPDKVYIQPNAHDGWFDGNKPNDNFVEYIRKDIADGMVESAEDHAYFAGQEKLREKLLEWAKERQAYYCKRADDIDDDSNHEMVYFYGKESAFRELIGKIESL